jgi:hypothetical protein
MKNNGNKPYLSHLISALLMILLGVAASAKAQTIRTIAGNGQYGILTDGPATQSMLGVINAVAVGSNGNVLFSDMYRNQVKQIDSSGTMTTFAGTGIIGAAGDGGLAVNAQLMGTSALAADSLGNVFIGGSTVRKVSPSGVISTVAGTVAEDCDNEAVAATSLPALQARLCGVESLAVDAAGNLYIGESHRVRKVDSNGLMTLFAGGLVPSYGLPMDGVPATSFGFVRTAGLAFLPDGSLLVSDTNGIVRIDTLGLAFRFAPSGPCLFVPGYWDYHPAIGPNHGLCSPKGIVTDKLGNVYVADGYGDSVMKIGVNGEYQTVAGPGDPNVLGDGGPAKEAYFSSPHAIALDHAGRLIVADTYNARVRRISRDMVSVEANGDRRADLVWHNESSGQVYTQSMRGLVVLGGAYTYDSGSPDWMLISSSDFDGDGQSDLLWRHSSTGVVWLVLLNGTSVKAQGAVHTEPNADWKIVRAADLNGDGRADIVWQNQVTGVVYVHFMDGLVVQQQGTTASTPGLNLELIDAADIDGDDKADLVFRNKVNGEVSIWLMNGLNTKSSGIVHTEPDLGWKIVRVGDVDGDGNADLIWFNSQTFYVYIQLMNGLSIKTGGFVYNSGSADWSIAAIGDYDGDGRIDLAWRNSTTGQIYVLLLNGLTVKGGDFTYTESNLNWKVRH